MNLRVTQCESAGASAAARGFVRRQPTAGCPSERSSGRRGSVLIVILWACLGLVSITLVFGHSMMMAYRGADNDIAGRQAEQAIEGALRYALFLLANLEEPGQLPLLETYETEQVPVDEARFWFIGRPEAADLASEPVFGLVDEASKLNLNMATQEMLEGLPGMTAEFAAAIIDWRDEDDEITSGGAESETYLLRRPSYACKNAPFETVQELALVNGATWTILYGEDMNRNGVLDPNENDGDQTPPEDDGDGRLDPGILEYVTVYSRESSQGSADSTSLNVNQSSDELRQLFEETFGEQRATEILARVSGTSNYRSLLEYFVRSGMEPDEFDQVAGSLTVSTNQYQPGLINVNTASEAVLACVPGIDEETASMLVATRMQRATPASSVAWVAGVLDEESAVQAGPYLTAQSWQVTADIAAVGRHGRGYRRTRFVIDLSEGTPQLVYRQNLASAGWALGAQVLQTLALEQEQR